MDKDISFFEELRTNEAIDLRDERGKSHNLALILVEFVLALLSNRDGNMSSIHRHMEAHHVRVCRFLGLEDEAPKKQ